MSFHFPIRIYYEDTDHAGVVYYANYLKFMERGRTEFLRQHDIQLDQIQQQLGVLFAVTQANIRYIKPALFNDEIHIQSLLTRAHGARLAFIQRVWRNNELLAEADITLACIDDQQKACRIPKQLLPILESQLHKQEKKESCHE
ncbi:MAG: tol-pal system-associated acyl-CoA thioesterase [Mariprofundaceae bacterium]